MPSETWGALLVLPRDHRDRPGYRIGAFQHQLPVVYLEKKAPHRWFKVCDSRPGCTDHAVVLAWSEEPVDGGMDYAYRAVGWPPKLEYTMADVEALVALLQQEFPEGQFGRPFHIGADQKEKGGDSGHALA